MESANITGPSYAKRQKRISNFTTAERGKLINEVRNWPRIWDNGDALRHNKNAVNQAWTQISSALDKPVEECKVAWVSMRESYRYHAKAMKRYKNENDTEDMLSDPLSNNDNVHWEFADAMSFLPDISPRKTPYAFPNFGETQSLSTDCDLQYDSPSKETKHETNRAVNEVQNYELWQRLDKVMETQKILMRSRESAAPDSPFKQAFACFDWLLQQLPKSVANEACLNFTQTLLTNIEEERIKTSNVRNSD